MKHFMCVHHWNNNENRERVKQMLDKQPMTDRKFFGFNEGEKEDDL